MPEVTVGKVRIHYEEQGEGEPVVFINGTGESGLTWAGQVMELAERYRCITPDNRDVGRSSYVRDPYTPAELAGDLFGFLDALDLEPAHLAGFSLGGAIVQEAALARPDRVRSVALISTWARSDPWFCAQMGNWQTLCERYSTPDRMAWTDEEAFLRALLPWIFSPATYAVPDLVEGYLAFALAEEPTQRPDGFLRQIRADIAHDTAERLATLAVPAFVLVGADDICTPPRFSRELCERIPAAELLTIPEAAHGAIFERPHEVNAALASFFARH